MKNTSSNAQLILRVPDSRFTYSSCDVISCASKGLWHFSTNTRRALTASATRSSYAGMLVTLASAYAAERRQSLYNAVQLSPISWR